MITLDKLNTEQHSAVTSDDKSILVNACVGSGKTTVLTSRISYLNQVKNVPLKDMMVLTFTNKAADEIKSRLSDNADLSDECKMFGTFHSVAMYLMLEILPVEETGWTRDFTIIVPEDELLLAEEVISDNSLKIKYKNRLAKRLDTEYKTYIKGGNSKYDDDLFTLFALLKLKRQEKNVMSYNDLILNCSMLLANHSFHPKYLIIDEVQDCNDEQVDLLKLLCGQETSFFAVGDPNQMIYGFRGSDDTLFYRIKREFNCREMSLSVNYRSEAFILKAANRFRQYGNPIKGSEISNEEKRIPVKNYYDPFQEAEILAERILKLHEEGVSFSEIAIFYRLKLQVEQLSKIFSRYEIPYIMSSEADTTPQSDDAIWFMTFHASKGLEFDYVFMTGLNQGLMPIITKSRKDLDEERRLFFVGMTRAKKYLEFSYYTNSGIPNAFDSPSDFLKMIPPELLDWKKNPTDKERRDNLQKLRKIVQTNINSKTVFNSSDMIKLEKKATHPKYGTGILIREDENVYEIEFEGYGKKEFLKIFNEITIVE